jgi:hypothetical protein
MNVPDQVQQICLFVTDDGFVTVLKQMAATTMAKIEGGSMAGQQPAHETGKAGLAGA